MRALRVSVLCLMVLTLLLSGRTAPVQGDIDLGREVLTAGDGWGSYGSGVSGGSAAAPEQVYTVTNRQELVAALNDGVYPPPTTTPSSQSKIIYVSGVIDANVDDDNNPLVCEDYFRDGFTYEAFLEAYDPATWGRITPTGPLEAARITSRNAQQARVRIRVGDNTTIVGLGKDATIRGVWFDIRGSRSGSSQTPRTNIIIRNITFEDTFDCFPAWSPTDGEFGSWNAEYDAISLRETTNVWIDHNTFRDRATLDNLAPQYFGVVFQRHDGLLDITNASDLVTVSWNRFENHDKVMLIGSSDTTAYDTGRLRVTLHHNLFYRTGQRTPRVRFGQVHIYNNFYKIMNAPAYQYAWGVGINSHIYAENNVFKTNADIGPANMLGIYKGTMIYAAGTRFYNSSGGSDVDVVAEYNALNDPDLTTDVSWVPTLYTHIDNIDGVINSVGRWTGPFDW